MIRIIFFGTLLLTAAGACSQTAAPQTPLPEAPAAVSPALTRQWRKIADLPPGTPLRLKLAGHREDFPCVLVWIDNNAVSCDGYAASPTTAHVVYPEARLASIVRQPDAYEADRHRRVVAISVGAGIGGLLGGLIASDTDAKVIFITTASGAAFGAAVAAGATNGPSHPFFGYRW